MVHGDVVINLGRWPGSQWAPGSQLSRLKAVKAAGPLRSHIIAPRVVK